MWSMGDALYYRATYSTCTNIHTDAAVPGRAFFTTLSTHTQRTTFTAFYLQHVAPRCQGGLSLQHFQHTHTQRTTFTAFYLQHVAPNAKKRKIVSRGRLYEHMVHTTPLSVCFSACIFLSDSLSLPSAITRMTYSPPGSLPQSFVHTCMSVIVHRW